MKQSNKNDKCENIALLSKINISWKNIISMKNLKEEIELLGHKNVITYLNSGNIILEIDRWSWDSTK